MLTQKIRLDSQEELVEVRTLNGSHYCHIYDVQKVFGFSCIATFKVDGVHIGFLEDDSGLPGATRLKHYPEQVIEVFLSELPTLGSLDPVRRNPSMASVEELVKQGIVENRQLHQEAQEQREENHRAVQRELQIIKRQFKAIWVQNYELHEYPIPRLFIILPERKDPGVDSWDLSNLFKDRFRLYFICEGGNHCQSDMNGENTSNDPADHIHPAMHKGYELERQNEFYQKFGRYVLGMLRFIKDGYNMVDTITNFAQPFTTKAEQEQFKEATQVNQMLSYKAPVQMAVDYLEKKLDVKNTLYTITGGQNMFNRFNALDGADLRRLESFLRKKDGESVLGNLWRVITPEGRVKWVCKYHSHKERSQEAKEKLLSLVSTPNQCSYQDNLRSLTLSLTEPTTAANVFGELKNLPCVSELNVSLAWKFNAADLEMMVRRLNDSTVQLLTLNLKDKKNSLFKKPRIKVPLKARKYQPLQGLYQNPHLRSYRLVGASRFGIRTDSVLGDSTSDLQILHLRIRFSGKDDQEILSNIIQKCPRLVDLRLGGVYKSEMHLKLAETIGTLKHLQILHLYGMENNENGGPIDNFLRRVRESAAPLRELVLVNCRVDLLEATELIKKSESTLEVLILDHASFQPLEMTAILPAFCEGSSDEYPLLRKLTSLHLHVSKDKNNIRLLAETLKRLSLSHLGLSQENPPIIRAALDGKSLLDYVEFASLRSLFLSGFTGPCLVPLWDSVTEAALQEISISSGADFPESAAVAYRPLESLSLEFLRNCSDLASKLNQLSLKSLWVIAEAEQLGCEVNRLAYDLDYSSLKKVALFRTKRSSVPESTESFQANLDVLKYFEGLEKHLESGNAKDMVARVGLIKEGLRNMTDWNNIEIRPYTVDGQGQVTRGDDESVWKYHDPRYHRYRWEMVQWSAPCLGVESIQKE
ncbi:hypothetical protein BGX26_005150 [Mortierella sp. AD094]|nr:hypothetical protein BGX26_005150 [Mortierella sp. AD094]